MKTFFFAVVSSAVLVNGQTVNAGSYPAGDQLAPANTAWASTFLNGVAIPNIAVRTTPLTSTDWTPDYRRCADNNDWALTYDDGPGPRTAEVLDELGRRNIKATFFVVGTRVLERPSVLKRIYDEGHEIAIHTWSHPYLSTVSNERIISEIVYTARAVKEITGVTPRLVRPPFGDIDPRVRAVLKSMGLDVVLWNYDTEDASGARMTSSAYFSSIIPNRDGPITLEHDLSDSTVNTAIPAISVAASSGYNMRTVSQCLHVTGYDESIWTRINGESPSSSSTSTSSSSSITTPITTSSSITSSSVPPTYPVTSSSLTERTTSSGSGSSASSDSSSKSASSSSSASPSPSGRPTVSAGSIISVQTVSFIMTSFAVVLVAAILS